MIDFKKVSISDARDLLLKREVSARELAEHTLATIEKENPNLNAFLSVYDDVLEQADVADKTLAKEGERAPSLTGIPIALKDNILVKGKPVTAGSKILEGYNASYDATAVLKLKASGAVLVGRTNMDEFALGSSTEKSAYGPTKNPWDQTRVPGGTSGGSAAAVASGMVIAALGSDTGGSVRQPASFCGIVGLKPTYGAVSRSGLIAAGSSFDQIGPLGKTIDDVHTLFSCIQGRDPLDSTSIPSGLYPTKQSDSCVIGVPRHFMESGLDEDLRQKFDESLARAKEKGAKIVDIELPNISYALPVYYILIFAEESSNLARFDGVRYGLRKEGEKLLGDYLRTRGEGFGPEVRRRIILGTYVLSAGYYDAYYGKATVVRKKIKDDFLKAFEQVDVIATPTTPTPPFKIGEKMNDPVSMYLEDIFTVTPNLTGMPAISVPMGLVTRDGKELPVGIQLTAPMGGEGRLFSAGELCMS
jgi:aspartyl-tRNA(Asn)/glutamyl-tRNA(Gln) amidotransferase subunit A